MIRDMDSLEVEEPLPKSTEKKKEEGFYASPTCKLAGIAGIAAAALFAFFYISCTQNRKQQESATPTPKAVVSETKATPAPTPAPPEATTPPAAIPPKQIPLRVQVGIRGSGLAKGDVVNLGYWQPVAAEKTKKGKSRENSWQAVTSDASVTEFNEKIFSFEFLLGNKDKKTGIVVYEWRWGEDEYSPGTWEERDNVDKVVAKGSWKLFLAEPGVFIGWRKDARAPDAEYPFRLRFKAH